MRLTVEEHVLILESYLKTMSYSTVDKVFFEKFRKKAPVKSAIAKMIKNYVKHVHFWARIVIGRRQC